MNPIRYLLNGYRWLVNPYGFLDEALRRHGLTFRTPPLRERPPMRRVWLKSRGSCSDAGQDPRCHESGSDSTIVDGYAGRIKNTLERVRNRLRRKATECSFSSLTPITRLVPSQRSCERSHATNQT